MDDPALEESTPMQILDSSHIQSPGDREEAKSEKSLKAPLEPVARKSGNLAVIRS